MKRRILKYKYLIAIFSFVFILNACGEADGSDPNENGTEEGRASAVKTMKLKGEGFIDYINVIGVVKPIYKASLGYQEGGIIDRFKKDKGDYIAKGDTILIIDNKAIKANLNAALAQYDLAQITFEKQEKVYKENINSEFQYLKSKYDRDAAKANYELMLTRYDKTIITAPFAGVIDQKYYEEGEYALPGSPIVYLINGYNLKVEAGVSEIYVGQIKEGDRVQVSFKDIIPEPIHGKVTYVGTSVIPDNRTFPIEVAILNKSGLLKPELVAELFIENSTYENVMIIPDEVVLRVDDGFIVFVENNGYAETKKVDIITRFADKIAVANGLNEGDNLIIVGYQNLVEGERVITVNQGNAQ
jgi:RND family efflux transporter MFP subunit